MPSFAHGKIAASVLSIDKLPTDVDELRKWVGAEQHLTLLTQNVPPEELIIYCSGPYAFIHSIIVPDEALKASTMDELLKWSSNPFTSYASYVSSSEDMWVEFGEGHRGCKALDDGEDLVFGRTFEGWSGPGHDYFEVNQEYTHLTGIHWRPEHSAYCKFDHNGDLRHVVSITVRDANAVSLVTFTWDELEEYLAVSNYNLVRMFDFSLLDHSNFTSWPDADEVVIEHSPDLFFRQKRGDALAYTRGIQIIRPRLSPEHAAQNVSDGWSGRKNKEYVEFIAQDWRHDCIARISTHPDATANYFNAKDNDKPLELSPAFFRPEVLSKYKTDRDKYTVGERSISCRSAWHLKGYDINVAGQIHAYICDLRALPYSEQLHWLSFNEEPKTGISDRAFINDFKGDFVDYMHPRQELISIARRWGERSVNWWRLRKEDLLDRANIPLTSSTDEWANAFLDLSKLVVEGFDIKAIRDRLTRRGGAYDEKEQSISLLEKLLSTSTHASKPVKLDGLRTTQKIRSKIAGHSGGTEAQKIVYEVIAEHGSYAAHFTHVCALVAGELEAIALAFED